MNATMTQPRTAAMVRMPSAMAITYRSVFCCLVVSPYRGPSMVGVWYIRKRTKEERGGKKKARSITPNEKKERKGNAAKRKRRKKKVTDVWVCGWCVL